MLLKRKIDCFYKDAKLGFALLKRDGLREFFVRLYWYLNGKRFPPKIYSSKFSKKSISFKPGIINSTDQNKLQVYFHIGPHKTGTTSIQAYLLRRFGSNKPSGSVWYPAPKKMGPGHAHLASIINNTSFKKNENSLKKIIDVAQNSKVEKLILSSEDFCLSYPDKIKRYADSLQGHDVVLITTQNSLINRVASIWQEKVKHGYSYPINDLSDQLFNYQCYQPDFLKTFAQALNPQKIVIVYSSMNDSANILIERILMAMGFSYDKKYDSVASVRRNIRLGYIEIELLKRFNNLLQTHMPEMKKENYRTLRSQFLNCFNSEEWREMCPQIPIDSPEYIREAAYKRALLVFEEFEFISNEMNVEIYGSPEVLLESKT